MRTRSPPGRARPGVRLPGDRQRYDTEAGPDTGNAGPRSGANSIFDFYTLEGAEALAKALQTFDHGRLVVHITEMPIKCPVAPLEFTFLAEAWLRKQGIRDRVELVFVTPLDGAFTQPVGCRAPGCDARAAQDPRRARLHGRARSTKTTGRWSRTTSEWCRSTCS